MKETGFNYRQIKWGVAALLLLYLLSVLVNLGMMELEGEEPRRAVVSIEMMHSGNYLNPTLFGWPYLNKPPVFNWILVGSMQLLQSASEFALRLPSLLFYMLWAAVHYRFSKQFFPRHLAFLSALMMLTCADIYFYGLANGAEIDIFYSFVVYLQAISIFHYFLQKAWLKLFVVSYAFCALGFLTKGFPSVVFEGLTLIAICIYARSIKPLFRWQHLAGGIIFLLAVGLYFWGYSSKNDPAHLLINFLNESLVKSAIGERSGKVAEKALGYPVLLIKLLAPWSLLLLTLIKRQVRKEFWTNPFVRFSFLFFVCNIWVYWLTGQPKARYIYMFVPFAITMLVQLYQIFVAVNKASIDRVLTWLGALFVLSAIGFFTLPFITEVSMLASVMAALLLAAFCLLYFKKNNYRIWAFITGIMLLRMAYATVIIPIQARSTAYYEAPVQRGTTLLNGTSLRYWAPPQSFEVAIVTSAFTWKAGSIKVPPLIHPQVPYYYYRHSGKLLLYDTIQRPNQNYISFDRDLKGQRFDSAYSFQDKRETERMVIYKIH